MVTNGKGCLHAFIDGIVTPKVWFAIAFRRFCPQALADALKVNKAVTDINLSSIGIGIEGAKAGCLARGTNVGVQDLGGF